MNEFGKGLGALSSIGKDALLNARLDAQQGKLKTLKGELSPGVEVEEAKKAAQQFESLLLKQMMDSMWKTVHSSGMLSGSKEEEQYRDMLNDALAEEISKGQGIGVSNVLLKELAKQRGYKNEEEENLAARKDEPAS